MLKNELRRAFFNTGMLLSLLIGHSISLAYIISIYMSHFKRMEQLNKYDIEIYNQLSQSTPFDGWILGHPTKYIIVFMYLLPILVVLPYADSYCKERKSGYEKNILVRSSRKKYRVAKCIAVFLSGGFVTASVVFMNLMWTFCYVPYREPISSSGTSLITGKTMLGLFYFEHPFIVCLLYILGIFMFSGAVALISLLISEFTTNVFTVSLTPFLIVMFFNSILVEEAGCYLPLYFLNPYSSSGHMFFMIPLVCTVVVTIVYIVFVKNKQYKDCL